MKTLVTGAAGQLGVVTVARFGRRGPVVECTRRDLDITDHDQVVVRVAADPPDVIVNCAAYNDVDRAESDALAALRANAFGPRLLARAAAAHGAILVHYGTDFVFDGVGDRPYTERDEPRPQSVYAASKLLGELFVLEYERVYVLRVESLFGGPAPRSSVDKIITALSEGREAPAFVDRVVSPSYVEDVAAATETLVTARAPSGLYHCVNDGHATWYEVGLELARLLGASTSLVKPIRLAEVRLVARRPRYCALDNGKLRAHGAPMPSWQDALRRYVDVRQALRSGAAAAADGR